jgi:predicted Zn-dependent protease
VLDSEKYARTQELAETARDFCDKVAQLSDTVATVVDAVDRQVRLASSAGVAGANETPRRFLSEKMFASEGRGTLRARRLPRLRATAPRVPTSRRASRIDLAGFSR